MFRRTATPARPTHRIRPTPDGLEDRLCPAVAYETASAVILRAETNYYPVTVTVSWNGDGSGTLSWAEYIGGSLNFTGKSSIVLQMQNQADKVTVNFLGDSTTPLKLTAELGGGDDQMVVNTGGFKILKDFRMYVSGGDGNDSVVMPSSPDVVGCAFLVRATLGNGDDQFDGSVGALIATTRPAKANFLVDGGAGNDSIHVLTGGTGLAFGNGCELNLTLRGAAGDDFINVDSLYTVSGTPKTKMLLDGGDGNDVVIADLERENAGATAVPFAVTVLGGTGDDSLSLSIRGQAAAGKIDGGAGTDDAFADNVATVLNCEN